MTKRDQQLRLLSGLNAGNAGHGQHIPFFQAVLADQVQRAGLECDETHRHSFTRLRGFTRHVHHAGASLFVCVREIHRQINPQQQGNEACDWGLERALVELSAVESLPVV